MHYCCINYPFDIERVIVLRGGKSTSPTMPSIVLITEGRLCPIVRINWAIVLSSASFARIIARYAMAVSVENRKVMLKCNRTVNMQNADSASTECIGQCRFRLEYQDVAHRPYTCTSLFYDLRTI